MDTIFWKKINKEASIPRYETQGSAAVDLRILLEDKKQVTLLPNESQIFGTGLAVEIPLGFVGLIVPRSGTGVLGLVIGNLVGVIDSDYRGEVKVCVWNRTNRNIELEHNFRYAQMLFLPVCQQKMVEVAFLRDTSRGERGFGSTGAY